MDGAPAYGHIVVGMDGSPTSRAALLWAAREAELRHCPLDVVYGWQVKGEPRPPGDWGGVAPPVEAYQEQAQARTQAIVDEVLPDGANCELIVHAVHKPAGRALLSLCGTADLLVVGAKERGRLAGWLVGSASDDALKNATCTVVVVRPPVGDHPAGSGKAAPGAAWSGAGWSGEERSGEERSGEERSGEERSGEERSGEERSGEGGSGDGGSGDGRSGEGWSGGAREAGSGGAGGAGFGGAGFGGAGFGGAGFGGAGFGGAGFGGAGFGAAGSGQAGSGERGFGRAGESGSGAGRPGGRSRGGGSGEAEEGAG